MNFLSKNAVFFSGLAAAIAVVLQQFIGETIVDWKVIGFAALMASLSFLANQWRGKGVSLLGIVGTLAATFVQVYNSGTFSWSQFLLYSVLAVLAAVAPPPKDESYEESAVIKRAKGET